MAQRGGDRRDKAAANGRKVGRPRNPVKDLAATGASSAAKILEELKHEQQIIELYTTCGDARLKTHIIFRMRDEAFGKPSRKEEILFPRNPDGSAQTVRVLVEHIGRVAHPAAAQAK